VFFQEIVYLLLPGIYYVVTELQEEMTGSYLLIMCCNMLSVICYQINLCFFLIQYETEDTLICSVYFGMDVELLIVIQPMYATKFFNYGICSGVVYEK